MLMFQTEFQDAYFLAELPEIRVVNSTEKVNVSITVSEVRVGSPQTQILNTSYFAYQNAVTIRDIKDIVGTYMYDSEAMINLHILISNGTDPNISKSFMVIYCQQRIGGSSAEVFLARHFLTTNIARFMVQSAKEKLWFYIAPRIAQNAYTLTATYSATVEYPDGTTDILIADVSWRSTGGLTNIEVSAAKVLGYFDLPAGTKLLCVSINFDGRRCTLYIAPYKNIRQFMFLNAFNVYETVALPMTTTRKMETDSSTAVCNDIHYQYDIKHKRTYEQQTCGLLLKQAEWLEQLLTSSDIRYCTGPVDDPTTLPRILIVDYDYSLGDEPGELNSIKFEWEFADARQATLVVGGSTNIFTEEFSKQFA